MEPIKKPVGLCLNDLLVSLEDAQGAAKDLDANKNLLEVEQQKIDRMKQSLEAMIKDAKRIESAVYRRARG
jgi:hypothetical protein